MNKIILCTILSFLFCIAARSQSTIVLEVSNFKNNNGVCRACLFNSPAAYEGRNSKPFQCISAFVTGHNARMEFNNILSGTYAVFVYHDVNNNNKMDKNFLGIPKEGYGASKNKLPYASAPTFNENKFTVNNKRTLLPIKLRNL
ncbi:MAG: DUF2141 domain-containing protein [Segetibacter sp.]